MVTWKHYLFFGQFQARGTTENFKKLHGQKRQKAVACQNDKSPLPLMQPALPPSPSPAETGQAHHYKGLAGIFFAALTPLKV